MTVSYVGAQGAAATTVTIPAHQVGDLILIFAYRDGSNTVPTAPTAGGTVPTWTQIGSSGGNTNSSRFHYAVATATNTTSGTWTSATELICLVYRGASIGASAGGSGNATTSIAYPALTLQRTDNTSWVVGVAGHRSATNVEVAPTGMTNRASSGTEAAGHDSNGATTSWSQQTVTVNASSAYRSWTVELRDKTVVLTAQSGSQTLTGNNATLSKVVNRTLLADPGAYTHTGQAASLSHNAVLAAAVRAFSVSGVAADLRHAARLVAEKATYALTGRSAGVNKGYRVAANTGLFNDNGVAASIRQTAILVAESGARSITGNQAGVNRGSVLSSSPGVVSISGAAATIIASGSKAVTVDKGTFLCTTLPASLNRGFTLTAATGAFTANPIASGVRHTARLSADVGSVFSTGNGAVVRKGFYLDADYGSYSSTGSPALLPRTYRVAATKYGGQINGGDSTRRVSRLLTSSAGSFLYLGLDSSRIRNRPLLVSTGSLATSGSPATFRKTLILRASGELVQYAGDQIQFVIRPPVKEVKEYAGGLLNIDQFHKARRIGQRFNFSGRR